MSVDLTQFHASYYEESLELLDGMEASLLEIEEGIPDSDTINQIFRAAHSIKGGAGTFGFQDITEFTHVCETLSNEIRSGKRPLTTESIETFLASVDCVRSMVSGRRDGGEVDREQIARVQAKLEEILGAASGSGETAGDSSTEEAAAAGSSGWTVEFRPHLDLLKTGNDPVRILQELASLGEVEVTADTAQLPPFREMDPEESFLGWTIQLRGNVTEAQILEVFEWVEDECDLTVAPLEDAPAEPEEEAVAEVAPVAAPPADTSPPAAGPARGAAAKKAGSENQSIRVSTGKIDDLINMVGELVITQSMLQQIGENFDLSMLEMLRDKLALLDRNTRELQESVMRIRMVPISFAFNRFPRMVHDLTKKLGKKIELKLMGEQTELDKTVMEKISDPLVHLVRNSLDHGLETPDVRREQGKPETGVLCLNAYHEGGNIVIEISDDGAGLNTKKILQRAIERGLVQEGESLTESRVHDLIFMPGFSTAEQISDISGRGVGMDVVRRNIASIGGTLGVTSKEGHGSTVAIRLPLTLAILDGQTVRVGNQNYILPLVSIVESIQVKDADISQIAGKAEVFKLRDEYLPVIRMYRIFDVVPQTISLSEGLIVVVESDRQKVGLFIDDLLGQQQVVIKSLETNFKKVDGISGATILGDGTVALILDVPGLVKLSKLYGDRPDPIELEQGTIVNAADSESQDATEVEAELDPSVA